VNTELDRDDQDFEAFLRQFRPHAPKARRATLRNAVALAIAAAIVAAVFVPRISWQRPAVEVPEGTISSGVTRASSARASEQPAIERDVPVSSEGRVPAVAMVVASLPPAGSPDGAVKASARTDPALRKTLRAAAPLYPAAAARVGLEGRTELILTVTAAGDVTALRRKSSTVELRPGEAGAALRAKYYAANPLAFATAAEEAARTWRFEAGTSPMEVAVSFTFALTPGGGSSLVDTREKPSSPGVSEPAGARAPGLTTSAAGLPRAPGAAVRGTGQPLRAGEDIPPPVRLVSVNPVYPEQAKAGGIEGVVVLEILIGEDGLVLEARVVRSIPELDQAAVDAVLQWQYQPTLLNGNPVEVEMTVTINFTLQR
jgi:TonB family protein